MNQMSAPIKSITEIITCLAFHHTKTPLQMEKVRIGEC